MSFFVSVQDHIFRSAKVFINIYISADKFGIWLVPLLIVTKQEIDFIVDTIGKLSHFY